MAIAGEGCLRWIAIVLMVGRESYPRGTMYGLRAAIMPSVYLPVVLG